VPKDIKAYDLDFSWGPGGPNGFAKPGADSLLPLASLLARPVRDLKGDEKNIAGSVARAA
jgi:hypothetical protein